MFELHSLYFSVSLVFVRAGGHIQANPHLPVTVRGPINSAASVFVSPTD